MAIRAHRRLAERNAANHRNLRRHLGCWQDTALTRLGTLAELQLEHLDLRQARHFLQLAVTQLAILVTHAVARRADLEYQVAATFQMIRRQPALDRKS